MKDPKVIIKGQENKTALRRPIFNCKFCCNWYCIYVHIHWSVYSKFSVM